MSKSIEKRTGSPFLDAVRSRIIESYTPEKIEKKVGEMWDAKDVRVDRHGEKYETPNWKAQDAALKTVLQLYGLENQESENQRVAPTKITVIVNGTEAKIKDEKVEEAQVIEAKEAQEIKANDRSDRSDRDQARPTE